MQKQPPEVFYKKRCSENFAKLTGKHQCQSLFFNMQTSEQKGFSTGHLSTTASENAFQNIRCGDAKKVQKKFFFKKSSKDRITHFNISVAVKRSAEINRKKWYSLIKCEKYSKSRCYIVKNFHMVKFCQIEETYRNFENLSIKRFFSHQTFCKSYFKVSKIVFPEMTNSIFNGRYIVKKTFTYSKFIRAFSWVVAKISFYIRFQIFTCTL